MGPYMLSARLYNRRLASIFCFGQNVLPPNHPFSIDEPDFRVLPKGGELNIIPGTCNPRMLVDCKSGTLFLELTRSR